MFKLCEILINKQKNITIENILKEININQIDDKTNNIFNQFSLKFKEKNKIFVEDNKYFVKEFNIDYEEDKKSKIQKEEKKENNKLKTNSHSISVFENKGSDFSEKSTTDFLQKYNQNEIKNEINLKNNG